MGLMCPECMGSLVALSATTARCSVHGGMYRILFQRFRPAVSEAAPAASVPAGPSPGLAAGRLDDAPAPQGGLMCQRHPDVPAVVLCGSCEAAICETCDFSFPGELHFCPTCATRPRQDVSSKRKRNVIIAYALALWSCVAFVVSVAASGANKSKAAEQALGMAIMVLVFIPAMVGTGLGLGSLEKRLPNPLWVWGAAIGNVLLLGGLILLAIVGSLMG